MGSRVVLASPYPQLNQRVREITDLPAYKAIVVDKKAPEWPGELTELRDRFAELVVTTRAAAPGAFSSDLNSSLMSLPNKLRPTDTSAVETLRSLISTSIMEPLLQGGGACYELMRRLQDLEGVKSLSGEQIQEIHQRTRACLEEAAARTANRVVFGIGFYGEFSSLLGDDPEPVFLAAAEAVKDWKI